MKTLLTLLYIFSVKTSALAGDAQKLIERADRARGGLNHGLSWLLEIKTNQSGNENESKYQVSALGDKILAVCNFPPRQKGETFLFHGRNLWVYRSSLRKPISVSTRTKLSGQASNGDIATTNYAKDYEAQEVGKEEINGEKTAKLLLKAKFPDLTYDQIHYWISEKSGLALQAEFLTPEGKPLKRATFTYGNSVEKDPFVSEMVITEHSFPANKSVLKYSDVKKSKLSEGTFNVNNLSR